jgi:hypothetical protein
LEIIEKIDKSTIELVFSGVAGSMYDSTIFAMQAAQLKSLELRATYRLLHAGIALCRFHASNQQRL